MARLWDKGLPLDERILRFTAGEDHRLDERLVEYDARASIAHARMLEQQKLLSAADCKAICDGLAWMGLELDGERNMAQTSGQEGPISRDGTRLGAYVIPTDEELLIARDTVRCVGDTLQLS